MSEMFLPVKTLRCSCLPFMKDHTFSQSWNRNGKSEWWILVENLPLLARKTAAAISWTGGLAVFVAILAFCWNIWTHYKGKGEEAERRKKADEDDEERRRRSSGEDEERRRKAEEEDIKRRETMHKEDAEREEARRAAEKQLNKLIEDFRGDYIQLRQEADAVKAAAGDVETRHNLELWARDEEIRDLRRENAELRRRIDSSPGWQPGGSGENSTATGG